MKFNIYFESEGNLNKLYEVGRNKTGLYLHPFGNRPHFTYHEDGKTWYRHPLLARDPNLMLKDKESLSLTSKAQNL